MPQEKLQNNINNKLKKMENIRCLSKKEQVEINGGHGLIYEIFYDFAKACVGQAEHARSSNGGKHGGAFHY